MRKNVFGRQFKRDANERKALFKNLLTSLVLHERIRTTQAKAKAIRGAADKLVTKAKKGGPNAYRLIHPQINGDAVKKLLEEIAPRFTERQGGYTRIIKAGRRISDNAEMAFLEWTERAAEVVSTGAEAKERKSEEVKATAKVSSEKKTKTVKKEKETKKKDK